MQKQFSIAWYLCPQANEYSQLLISAEGQASLVMTPLEFILYDFSRGSPLTLSI